VGGAVNVISNSIPDTAPDGRAHGAAELRMGGAARERALVLASGGGGNGFAAQVNAMSQRSGDVAIPGVARIDVDAPAQQIKGRLSNSAVETFSGSVGGTVFWGQGHAGAAVSHYETEYGVPNGESDPVSIHLRQTRLDYEVEVNSPWPAIRSLKARLGQGDYWHAELSNGTHVNTTFTNRAAEGRLELTHSNLGPLSGMVGLQGSRSDFAAVGSEVATPPSLTESGAFFVLEDLKLGEATTLQAGGRAEVQRLTVGKSADTLPLVPGYSLSGNAKRTFAGTSGSVGVVHHPARQWSVAAAVALSSRLPTTQELFSNGPHGGTGTYEVGRTGLKAERSTGLDLSVRHRGERVSGAVSVFTHRFRGYIFQQDIDDHLIPESSNPDGFRVMQYVARDARFSGAELEVTFHLLPEATRRIDLELGADTVRASAERPTENLPRLPAAHHGVKLVYDDGRIGGTIELRRTAPQQRVAPGETTTPGHTVLNVNTSFQLASAESRTWELFARGTNLTNVEAREHGSFLKEFAPLPGRGVLGGVRLRF
jgi:iron complex outermembrane receptor protein